MSGELGGLLTQKATFLLNTEVTFGVNPVLGVADAFQVSDPDWTVDPTVLAREYASNDLSPYEDMIGKIIAGFKVTVEVKSNGRAQSGLVTDMPMFGRLLLACGYTAYGMVAAGSTVIVGKVGSHSPVTPDPSNSITAPKVTFASQTDATSVTEPVLYTLQVVNPGASGVATFMVTSNSKAEDATMGDYIAAPVATTAITSGTTKILLGAKGGSLIPTWAGALVAGQKWSLAVFPLGVQLRPISSGFSTASMEMNRDGVHLEGNAGIGNFTVDAPSGEIAKATFTFTTTFVQPNDALIPSVDFSQDILPPLVELSTFTWGGNRNLMVEKWSYDQSNTITVRPSVNHAKGYAGSRITDRNPSIGFNPEATHEADHPFWDEWANAKSKTFLTRIGTQVGNQTVFYCGKSQTSDQKFTDRAGVLTYDKTAKPKRLAGNDETIIVFC